METARDQLWTKQTQQVFEFPDDKDKLLENYKQWVEAYVKIEKCIGVLSVYDTDTSYIYFGEYGRILGHANEKMTIDSSFEDEIFSKIHPDDVNERHILELRFYQFMASIPIEDRENYHTESILRFLTDDGEQLVLHKTFPLACMKNGSIWLSMCIYSPAVGEKPRKGIGGRIVNNVTGERVNTDVYEKMDKQILSARELDILSLLAKGLASKEIADRLNISVYTVYRHRQNIITKLRVRNTAEAVQIGMEMRLI